jgi:hypothetical protein
MDYKYRVTLKSRNKKTGPIMVTTTEKKSCPKACPLKDNGCYADGGPLAIVWRDTETMGKDIDGLCDDIRALKPGALWRHNQAGDLPHKGETIDFEALVKIVDANKGKRGFTYSHHDMRNLVNQNCVEFANTEGFTINLSANNLTEADQLKKVNIGPVVVVLPENQTTNIKTPAGNKVTVCPAAIDKTDKINCANCKLCAISDRETIIGFPAHGMRKKKAGIIASA